MKRPKLHQLMQANARLSWRQRRVLQAQLAAVQARSLSDVLRLAILAGLPAVQDLTAAPIFEANNGAN